MRFLCAQERDNGILRIALFGGHRLRVRIESHTNRGVPQQLLHDLQFGASRPKQRRIGMTKSMSADSLRDAKFSRDRKDVMPHDLMGQIRPAALFYRTREHPAL